MKSNGNPRQTFLFMFTAVAVMVFMHFGSNIFNALVLQPTYEPLKQEQVLRSDNVFGLPERIEEQQIQMRDDELALVIDSYLSEGADFPGVQLGEEQYGPFMERAENTEVLDAILEATPKKGVVYKPSQTRPEYEAIEIIGQPKIAIIIDDMGMDRKHSLELAEMDENLTLAFLPYAPSVQEISKVARANGHELMIHMPMEAMNAPVSLGSIALKSGMSHEAVNAQLNEAFASFEGYEGLNNHMGSKLTQDPKIMGWVMARLKERGLYFVDSVTIATSVAENVARDYGLAAAKRDVFLDHYEDIGSVRKAFARLEHTANKQGYAIAIGHPKAATIQGLKEWLPQAKTKGYEIVFASALVSRPKAAAKVAAPDDEIMEILEMPETDNRDVSLTPFLIEPAAGEEVIRWQ